MPKDKSPAEATNVAETKVATEKLQIEVTNNKTERSLTVDVDFPKTIEGMQEVFGTDVTYDLAKRQYKIAAQSKLRGMLGQDKEGNLLNPDDEAILKEFSEWKPGIATKKTASVDKLIDKARNLSDDDLDKLIAEAQARRSA